MHPQTCDTLARPRLLLELDVIGKAKLLGRAFGKRHRYRISSTYILYCTGSTACAIGDLLCGALPCTIVLYSVLYMITIIILYRTR